MLLGLDLGARAADFAATADGHTFRTGKVTLAKFPDLLADLAPNAIACEYTGRLAERWCLAAEAHGITALIMHSGDRKAYTTILGQSVKTDAIDAHTIARLLYLWQDPTSLALLPVKAHIFTEAKAVREAWKLRALFASVDKLTQLQTAAKNRVTMSGLTGNAHMAGIWQQFADSTAAKDAAAEVIAHARTIFPREMELLETIPRIGPQTAAFLCASLLPIERFKQTTIRRGREYDDTYRNLRRYAGLYPKVEQSGKMNRAQYLSRRGSPALRGALYMCALGCVGNDNRLGRYYERQKERLGSGRAALTLVSVKILTIAAAVLLSDTPYFDPDAVVKPTRPAYLIPQADAARRLGISRQAVSLRVKNGKLRAEEWDGTMYVVEKYLDLLIAQRTARKGSK